MTRNGATCFRIRATLLRSYTKASELIRRTLLSIARDERLRSVAIVEDACLVRSSSSLRCASFVFLALSDEVVVDGSAIQPQPGNQPNPQSPERSASDLAI